jgi:hypothetical protein
LRLKTNVADSSIFVRGIRYLPLLNAETLQNSIKRKHPRKGEKKKQMARTKSPGKQANSPKIMEPVNIKPPPIA